MRKRAHWRSPFERLAAGGSYALLMAGGVVMVFPFVWMVTSALKTPQEVTSVPLVWLPARPQWYNFVDALRIMPLARMFLNSLVVTSLISTGIVITSSLVGFALAKYEFPGRQGIFLFILATMMIPFFILLTPLYYIVKELGWLNTYQGVVVPHLVSAFGIFLMRQFMLGIPDELLDAARIDGASELAVWWRIVLPLSKPALASLGIFSFIYQWNDFLWPLAVLQTPQMFTLPVGLTMLRSFEDVAQYANVAMAAATLAVLPPLIVFLVLQRHFIKGITLTGLKE